MIGRSSATFRVRKVRTALLAEAMKRSRAASGCDRYALSSISRRASGGKRAGSERLGLLRPSLNVHAGCEEPQGQRPLSEAVQYQGVKTCPDRHHPEIHTATVSAYLRGLSLLCAEVAASNPNFKKFLDSLTAYSNNGYQWFQVAEVGYDNFMARHSQS